MGFCGLSGTGGVCLLAATGMAAQVAPIPRPDELPGRPYAIEKKWVIGGSGNWDYLTLDPAARQLFVTHQNTVQVVDVDSGAVAGQVSGFGEAHAVALNPNGETGYVSDGRANKVFFFDRRTFRIDTSVDVPASPRALVFEPATGWLFSFGAMPTPTPSVRNPVNPAERAEASPCSTNGGPAYQSLVSIIDPGKETRVADVIVCGVLGAAVADGRGGVYFAMTDRNAVGRLNASSLAELTRTRAAADLGSVHGSIGRDGVLLLDFAWAPTMGGFHRPSRAMDDFTGPPFRVFSLWPECKDVRAVAVDGAHQRLFAGCTNQKLKVVATDTGSAIATLTIGPGVDEMAYDADRGLIFTANGGGYGSVTIVRQHLSDSYAVIQNLPTLQQARTMAIDPSTGLAYLVTTLYGADLRNPPANGIGTLKMNPVDGSFQVLVVGN